MGNTPNLNLLLTPEDDTTTTFKAWRVGMNGEDSNSNMIKIDKAYGDLNKKTDNIKAKVDVVSDKVFGEAPKTWADVQTIVRNGAAEQYFDIGDQFIVERLSTVTASIGESTGITAATVNADIFVAGCGEVHAGEYLFTYDGKSWRNESGSIIAIAEYGIEVTGTPVAGDHVVVTETTTQLTFDIIGIDQDTLTNSEYTHSMTLQLHDPLDTIMRVDFPEYTWYIDEEMAPGTYKFTLPAGYETSNGGEKTYYFDIENPVLAGGVIRFDWGINKDAATCKITTWSSRTATDPIETVPVSTEGDTNNELTAPKPKNVNYPTTDESAKTIGIANALDRSRFGSNDWATSNIRQWLNSDGEANSWWQPQTDFDKAPYQVDNNGNISGYANIPGFLNRLDPEFLAVIGEVKKVTRKNSAEGSGLVESKERFFLLSQTEVYGGDKESLAANHAPYTYYGSGYSDLTSAGTGEDTNRIKYIKGVACTWTLRTVEGYYVYIMRGVKPGGKIMDASCLYPQGISPACCIV